MENPSASIVKAENYWDKLMATDEGASSYMLSYGEGPGCETRRIISQHINDGESVLDIGCGPGWNYDHFKSFGPKIGAYRGIDYSQRFVKIANARMNRIYFKDDPNHIALFVAGNVHDPQEPDESWDVVILQDVLEHTNGYEAPLQHALRIARNRIIVTFWRMSNDTITKTNDDGDDGYGSDYNQSEWEDYLSSMGYFWHSEETSASANRWHRFYIIDKGGKQI